MIDNNPHTPARNEVPDAWLQLMNGFCDERLSATELTQLSDLLRSDDVARRLFVEITQIHGQLSWDVAHVSTPRQSAEALDSHSLPVHPAVDRPLTQSVRSPVVRGESSSGDKRSTVGRRAANVRLSRWHRGLISVSVIALLFLAVTYRDLLFPANHSGIQLAQPHGIVEDGHPSHEGDTRRVSLTGEGSGSTVPDNAVVASSQTAETIDADRADPPFRPLELDSIRSSNNNSSAASSFASNRTDQQPEASSSDVSLAIAVPDSDEEIVEVINALLAASWAENEVEPLAEAPADEWLRRAWLSFCGAIPPSEVARSFVMAPDPRAKRQMVDQLLLSEQTSENLAVIWVNLMIGRSNPGDVDEPALYEFMRQSFSQNVSWMETVCELMSAEGRSDQNGATNFLLAHLNNQATPATAVTARLFLGQQVQCTQCHNHPFASGVRQDEFWGLNAFFKQTRREAIPASATETRNQRIWKLADNSSGGMTFYETPRGQQKAVLPEFGGVILTADTGIPRRAELARLVQQDPHNRVAAAMVNRMWHHFFGAGFTTPIDDMGPHTPVSHPELLDFLTRAFSEKNYDVRRLMTWMALSDAWQLASSLSDSGSSDSGSSEAGRFLPRAGGVPLFNQVYARHLVPEEVYDSLRTAIHSIARHTVDSSWGTTHRREWVAQFVEAYGTDENDEWLQFDGNISQALMMMNGTDLQHDIALAVGQLRTQTGRDHLTVGKFLPELSLATLSRLPSDVEQRVFQNRLRQLSRTLGPEQALQVAAEDMVWAYLNSSEFILVR